MVVGIFQHGLGSGNVAEQLPNDLLLFYCGRNGQFALVYLFDTITSTDVLHIVLELGWLGTSHILRGEYDFWDGSLISQFWTKEKSDHIVIAQKQ